MNARLLMVVGSKRKAARKRKSMEEGTERAAAVKKKKAEKNALVDSEPRSSRNGHNMVTPHRAQATLNHRNSVHAPPSLRIDIRAQGGSLPPNQTSGHSGAAAPHQSSGVQDGADDASMPPCMADTPVS
jgi:hypothetical protein